MGGFKYFLIRGDGFGSGNAGLQWQPHCPDHGPAAYQKRSISNCADEGIVEKSVLRAEDSV